MTSRNFSVCTKKGCLIKATKDSKGMIQFFCKKHMEEQDGS